MITVVPFTEDKIESLIQFEKELRKQEPNTYFWEPDSEYEKNFTIAFMTRAL